MENIARIYTDQSSKRFFGTAYIIKSNEKERGTVVVALNNSSEEKKITARLAIESDQSFTFGDEVLVVEDNQNNFFIIGVLRKKHRSEQQGKLSVADGAYASITTENNRQLLSVHSSEDELLFKYDPHSQKASIFSGTENVVFEATNGNIEINAAGKIHLNANQIEFSGKSEIEFSVGKLLEKTRTALSLTQGKLDVSSRDVKVSARRTALFIEQSKNAIKSVISRIESVRLMAGKVETKASSIIEKTENSYRTVEKLNQVKSGRMRMLIHNAFNLKSKTTVIKADDDVKVKGEKIHLG